MIRQRQHCLGESRIVVAVLDPTVTHQDIVAHPTDSRRGLLRETQRHFVAGIHDYVAVVNFLEQFAHLAKAGVIANQIAPDLFRGRNLIVVGHFRRRSIRLIDHRVTTIVQVSRRRSNPHRFQLRIGKPLRPLDRVPEDLEISTQPQTARCAGAEDICEIEQADLLASGRKTQVWFGHNPAALAIGDFHAQWLRMDLLALTNGHVD